MYQNYDWRLVFARTADGPTVVVQKSPAKFQLQSYYPLVDISPRNSQDTPHNLINITLESLRHVKRANEVIKIDNRISVNLSALYIRLNVYLLARARDNIRSTSIENHLYLYLLLNTFYHLKS